MKNLTKTTALIFVLVITAGMQNAFAQDAKPQPTETKAVKKEVRDMPPRRDEMTGMSDDQRKKIKEIYLKAEKEINPLKNQLAEKKAHLKTLTTSDNPDMNEISKTIDDMMAMKSGIMKREVLAKQEIRKQLSDEQKIAFDKRMEMHKKDKHEGPGHQGPGPRPEERKKENRD